MKYNYKKVREEVYKTVKKVSYSKENVFDDTVWDYHILPVVEHALALGRKLKASSTGSLQIDLEVLELAALLHDYANLVENGKHHKNHHLQGAELAGKILSKLKYPEEKIEHIKDCIFSHRGSVKENKKTIEAKILASADGMAHITELADMFFLVFYVRKYKTREGCKWLRAKLKRDWNKIMSEGRSMIKEDYKIAINILNNVINRKKL